MIPIHLNDGEILEEMPHILTIRVIGLSYSASQVQY